MAGSDWFNNRSEAEIGPLKGDKVSCRALVESMNEGVLIMLPDRTIIYANSQAVDVFEVPLQKLIGSSIDLYIASSDISAFSNLFEQAIESSAKSEFLFKVKSGDVVPVSFSMSRLVVKDIICVSAIISDLTELKKVEEAIARLAAIVEYSEDAIIGKTPYGIITSWNHGAEKLYGYSAEEVIGKSISILAPSDKPDEIPGILEKIRQGDRVEHLETKRVRKDGNTVYVYLAVSPIKDSNGHIVGAATVAHDITKQKVAEENLKDSERFTRETIDALSASIAILDESGFIRYTNRAWKQFAKDNCYTKSVDMIGINYLDTCNKAQGEDSNLACEAVNGIRELVAGTKDVYEMEYPCHSADEQRWFTMRATTFYWQGENYIVVAHENITGRKRAEEAMRESVRELQSVFDATLTALLIIDDNGIYIDANPAACELFHLPKQDLLGRKASDFVPSEYDVESLRSEFIKAGKLSGEIQIIAADESIHDIEYNAVLNILPGRHLSAIRDITERKKAESDLKNSEDKFSKAFHSSPEMMSISRMSDGKYLDVNQSFVELIGYTHEEAIGRTAYDLDVWVEFDDRIRIIQMLRERKTVRNLEILFRTKSKNIFTGLLSAETIELSGEQCLLTIVSDISERKKVEIERENARKALEEVYERERRIAETLQRNFLPDRHLEIDGYHLADAYYPALDEAAIGGDVYDVFMLPDGRVGVAIADVSGKGLTAGRYGAMVKYMLRAYSYRVSDPGEVLSMLNDSVAHDLDIDSFITCFFAILDPAKRSFIYCNAGHEEPLYIPNSKIKIESLKVTGSALGIELGSKYTVETIDLNRGDILLLYTDGVTDARGVMDRMGVTGLRDFIESHLTRVPEELIESILSEVQRRSGDRLADDVAMLVLKVER